MSKGKPCKQLASKNLSGLGGVKDVSFGPASVERRADRDFSKDGISQPASDSFDDYNERRDRFSKALGF